MMLVAGLGLQTTPACASGAHVPKRTLTLQFSAGTAFGSKPANHHHGLANIVNKNHKIKLFFCLGNILNWSFGEKLDYFQKDSVLINTIIFSVIARDKMSTSYSNEMLLAASLQIQEDRRSVNKYVWGNMLKCAVIGSFVVGIASSVLYEGGKKKLANMEPFDIATRYLDERLPADRDRLLNAWSSTIQGMRPA